MHINRLLIGLIMIQKEFDMKKVMSAAAMVVFLTGCDITEDTNDMLAANKNAEQDSNAVEVVCRRFQPSGRIRHVEVCEPKGSRKDLYYYARSPKENPKSDGTATRWVEGFH
jgi:hypothetical protein